MYSKAFLKRVYAEKLSKVIIFSKIKTTVKNNIIKLDWNAYKNHVHKTLLSNRTDNARDISYWRNEIFYNILTFLAPLSIIALVPSVYMSFHYDLPVVGFTDLFAFSIIILIMVNPSLQLHLRKFIFIFILYFVAIVLLYYLGKPGPGFMWLLSLTILTSIIYSPAAAYYSAWANTIICVGFGGLIYSGINISVVSSNTFGTWVAVSSNLILLSFVCAYCLNLLLTGFETSMNEEKKSEANLNAIIQNTDANIYSLDTNLRYITFNDVLKNSLKGSYNIDIKPGDKVIDFFEKTSSEEALEWERIYEEALVGKALRFEKDFNIGQYHNTVAFSVNPIIENKKVIGLSCFANDITERKLAESERIKITNDLIQRNRNLEQFSYIVSHNLRSPVANIIGLSSIAQDENLEPGMKKEILTALSNSVEKLDNVITDLNLILQTKSEVTQQKEIVHFSEMAIDIHTNMKNLIEKEKAIIVWNFSEVDEILTLKSYMHSIFFNLISNSLKYRQPKISPVIEIKSKKTKDGISLQFKDNGIGIDLKAKGHLVFGLYKRFHIENTDGKGMGLYMVKIQVESLGGKISIRSEVNKGTEFKIEFEN